MRRLHETTHAERFWKSDAIAFADRHVDDRGESFAIVERLIWTGDRLETHHDATAYGTALATGVDPASIVTWRHPHGSPPITDARMTALYAAELAELRMREEARS